MSWQLAGMATRCWKPSVKRAKTWPMSEARIARRMGVEPSPEGQPEAITRQITEGQIRVVLVVVLLDEQEAGGEAVAEFLTPRNALGRGEPLVNEVEGGEQ
jgi:hypothetical protein